MESSIKRIHICGIYGSGKTTLARKLSELTSIPFYSLDDIKYIIKYSKIRSVSARLKKVNSITKKKKWITEGSWSNYAQSSFENADLIILLNPTIIVCVYRVLKRYFLRKKQENDTFIGSLGLIKQIFKYHFTTQPVSLHAHKTMIDKFSRKKKIIYIRTRSDLVPVLKLFK